ADFAEAVAVHEVEAVHHPEEVGQLPADADADVLVGPAQAEAQLGDRHQLLEAVGDVDDRRDAAVGRLRQPGAEVAGHQRAVGLGVQAQAAPGLPPALAADAHADTVEVDRALHQGRLRAGRAADVGGVELLDDLGQAHAAGEAQRQAVVDLDALGGL